MSGASLRNNAFVLGVATAVIAIVGDWSGDETAAILWRVPAALLLLGLGYESWLVSRVAMSVRITAVQQFFLGRGAALTFDISHDMQRTWPVELAPAAPDFFEIDEAIVPLNVAPNQAARFERRVTATRLGKHIWPQLHARVGGPLGLAWWPKELRPNFAVAVKPDLFRSANEVRGTADAGAQIGFDVGGGTEVMRLRDYRDGDPPRVVDWKATARAGRLISRDLAMHDGLQIVIAIDAGRTSGLRAGHLDRFGHYVNIAARLAQLAADRDDLVGIVVYADRPLAALAPARGAHALVRLRELLASSRVENRESNPLLAAMRVRSLVRHRSLVIFLTDVDDATAGSQLAQAARLLLPQHLPFIAGLSSEAAQAMARAPASEWLDPFRALAAQEYCGGLERKVSLLNSLGAAALIARPQHLEHAVFAAYADFRRRRRV
jgi:uncharacterized protein (DUF58 family)